MFFNLAKNLSKAYNRSIIIYTSRYQSFYKEKTEQIKHEEEDSDLKIEASLFDNSAVKYEPIKKYELLKKRNVTCKSEANNKLSRPQKVTNLKKTHTERKAESELINDKDLGLQFLRLSLNDPRLSTLLITVRSKKRRDKDRQIVIEGRRLILEALSCGLRLNNVIFSQKEQLADIKEHIAEAQKQYDTKIYKVPHHGLKIWSTLITPPGVMAIFDRPSLISVFDKISSDSNPLPITVVCDNIREPNNLGSIIRTCAALPCMQVVTTQGCCDPWESKALRGGCGGQFRLPIRDDVEWGDVPLMIPPEVADDCYVFVAENNFKKLQKKSSITDYSEIEKTGSHNVIIVGGESHGVSQDAYRFMEAVGQRGRCIFIPLAQGIDSLNVASALTLILYELRKNIIKSNNKNLSEIQNN